MYNIQLQCLFFQKYLNVTDHARTHTRKEQILQRTYREYRFIMHYWFLDISNIISLLLQLMDAVSQLILYMTLYI